MESRPSMTRSMRVTGESENADGPVYWQDPPPPQLAEGVLDHGSSGR